MTTGTKTGRASSAPTVLTWIAAIALVAAGLFGTLAWAQHDHAPGQAPAGHDHAAKGGHDATIHHAFDDADAWAKVFDDPKRDEWQKPHAVLEALGVTAGQRVADLGAGTGYFTLRLAHHVGEKGVVYAVDVEPKLVEHVRKRAAEAKLAQVRPVLAAPDDPKLPAGGVDLVLIVDTWHHIDARDRYLRVLRRALAPHGRIAVVDFMPGDIPVGPPPEHRLPAATITAEFEAGGFRLVAQPAVLPYQFVLVFEPVP